MNISNQRLTVERRDVLLQDLNPSPLVAVPYVTTQRYSSNRTYVIKMTSSVNDTWNPVVTEEVGFDELPVSHVRQYSTSVSNGTAITYIRQVSIKYSINAARTLMH